MQGDHAGHERHDNGLRMKLCWCPSGKFRMGHADSKSAVEVNLSRGFWLGKHEVTQQEYERVMHEAPSYFSAEGLGAAEVQGHATRRFPVEQVSWEDAAEFCRRLTIAERKAGRLSDDWEFTLPTEAQWEYACRAGTTTKYSFGNHITPGDVHLAGDKQQALGGPGPDGLPFTPTTTNVGSYPANAWGLCDMHGNVWEWCRDWYSRQLVGGIDPESASPDITIPHPARIYRGGGWECNAYRCESATRHAIIPSYTSRFLGFRVALSPCAR